MYNRNAEGLDKCMLEKLSFGQSNLRLVVRLVSTVSWIVCMIFSTGVTASLID